MDRDGIEVINEQCQGGTKLPAGDFGLIELHSLHA